MPTEEPSEAAMREAEELRKLSNWRLAKHIEDVRREERYRCAKVVRESVRRVPLPADARDDTGPQNLCRIVYHFIDASADKLLAGGEQEGKS